MTDTKATRWLAIALIAVLVLVAAVAARGGTVEPTVKVVILSEGKVCDGYDVMLTANATRMTIHLLAKPKDTLTAVTPLAVALHALAAADATPEAVKLRKLAEVAAAIELAYQAVVKIAEVKAAYPTEKLPTVTIIAATAEAPK